MPPGSTQPNPSSLASPRPQSAPPSTSQPRVLLIGRRFWPHGSIDSASYLIRLATDLSRRGIDVEVLTPQYASSWPSRLSFRELTVHRPMPAPRFGGAIARDWSVNRYVRLLGNWIREHGSAYDVLFIDRAQEELLAAIDAATSLRCATMVRMGGWDESSDVQWWQTNRLAGRCMAFARRADAVVTKNAREHRDLIGGAFKTSQLVRIDDGFATGPVHNPREKAETRRALAAINCDLAAPANMPVLLCCAPMRSHRGIQMLIDSARVLVARYPTLRLWFVGDGPYRDTMYDRLRSEGVRKSVAMPGSFAEMNDLFIAADVYVQCDETGLDSFLRQAISAELPIVSIDSDAVRAVISGVAPSDHAKRNDRPPAQEHVAWYEPGKIKSLRSAIRGVLDDRPASLDRARELRRFLCRQKPHHQAVDAYVQLIRRLANPRADASQPRRADTSSIETAS